MEEYGGYAHLCVVRKARDTPGSGYVRYTLKGNGVKQWCEVGMAGDALLGVHTGRDMRVSKEGYDRCSPKHDASKMLLATNLKKAALALIRSTVFSFRSLARTFGHLWHPLVLL